MFTRCLLPITFISLALLGGCGALTQQRDATLATSSQLDARFAELEQTLSQRFENEQAEETAWQRRQDRLGEELQRIDARMKGLRAEIARLHQAPKVQAPVRDMDVPEELRNKTLLGSSEWVGLPTVGTYLQARIDSGAETSSLSATDITEFERDGDSWVRFKLALEKEDEAVEQVQEKSIEAPIERRVRILQSTGEESRPVVSLPMTLGSISQNVEFTLNDRRHLSHPVLLGRNFMRDIAIIDVAEKYRHPRPEFPSGEPSEVAKADEVANGKNSD